RGFSPSQSTLEGCGHLGEVRNIVANLA
ncbi:MAG: hypothetical protein RLZZ486_329, partial [Actinomycetota bacterium]